MRKKKLKTTIPYTYLIGWTKLDKWYYGARYRVGSDPSDLWVKYFTSSRFVKKFREENGEPDIIQIRKVFADRDEAIIWECKVLRRMSVARNRRWLNMHNGGKDFVPPRFNTEETRKKKSKSHIGLKEKPETRLKKSLQKIGPANPMYGKGYLVAGTRNPMYGRRGKLSPAYGKPGNYSFLGKKHTEETKRIISEKSNAFQKKKHRCEHCGKEISYAHYVQWHGDRCKHKVSNKFEVKNEN